MAGNIRIPMPDRSDTLYIAAMGYYEASYAGSDLIKLSTVTLQTLIQDLEMVEIIGRTDLTERMIPYQVQRLAESEITFQQSPNAADALAATPGVFVQKSQMGGGSPIIRGFEANRVLLVVDGVRMNNIIYRSGHLQNAITVDAQSLEQMEVIFGPGSLMYGSDALGGVVHFRTKSPKVGVEKGTLDLNASMRYASASRQKTAHVDFGVGGKGFGYWGGLTFSDFGDLRTGRRYSEKYPEYGKRLFYVDTEGTVDRVLENDQTNLQIGTGYQQFDMIHKLKWAPSLYSNHTLNFQLSTSSDIPRYDQLTDVGGNPSDLTYAEWYYGPQDRLLLSSRHQFLRKTSFYDKSLVIASYQKVGEDRINRRFGSDRRSFQLEEVDVLSLTVDLNKQIAPSIYLSYGGSYDWNDLNSQAYAENRAVTIQYDDELTRYPDNDANMQSGGIYANGRASVSEQWTIHGGVRLSHVITRIQYNRGLVDWPERFITGINNPNTALTWGLGVDFRPSEAWQIKGQLGSAFRAPNVDDLAKIRIKGGSASVPNPDLKPEHAIQSEVSLAYHSSQPNGQLSFQVTGFYTQLEDAIVQMPYPLPNGDSMLLHDGESFSTVGNLNAEKGKMWGFMLQAMVPLARHLKAAASFNVIKGKTFDLEGTSTPMAHLPPTYGQVLLTHTKGPIKLEGIVRFNGAKKLEDYSNNSADNIEKATPEGTLAWTTYNVYGAYDFNETFSVQLAVENILDIHYRPFASGVSAPGRNISVSLRAAI